jgi:hypothetical protein
MLVLFKCEVVYLNTTVSLNTWLIIQMHLMCILVAYLIIFSHTQVLYKHETHFINYSFYATYFMNYCFYATHFMNYCFYATYFMNYCFYATHFMNYCFYATHFMNYCFYATHSMNYCLYAKHFTNHCCYANTSIEWQLLLCKHFYGPHWNLCFLYTITRISLSPWIPLCPNSWTVNSCWEARML